MSALIRLYPRSWRERYEAEFLSLMETRPPTIGDRVDIVRGAVDARLHPQTTGSAGDPANARRRASGPAAIATLAGVAWLVWLIAALSEFRGWDGPMPGNAALIAVLSLVAGLSTASAHAAVAVFASDHLRPMSGPAVAVAVVTFAGTAFGVGALGTPALIASAVFAVSLRTTTIPGWLSATWAGSAVLTAAAMVAFVASGGSEVWLLGGIATYGIAWLAIGGYLWVRGMPQSALVEDLPTPTPPGD